MSDELNAEDVRTLWTSMGEDRPCFVVTNGAWTVDAFPHAFWPVLWVVHSSEGRAVWAIGRRHALRRARHIGARRLFAGAQIDGLPCA